MEVIEEDAPRLGESEWQGMKGQELRGKRGDNGCGERVGTGGVGVRRGSLGSECVELPWGGD